MLLEESVRDKATTTHLNVVRLATHVLHLTASVLLKSLPCQIKGSISVFDVLSFELDDLLVDLWHLARDYVGNDRRQVLWDQGSLSEIAVIPLALELKRLFLWTRAPRLP